MQFCFIKNMSNHVSVLAPSTTPLSQLPSLYHNIMYCTILGALGTFSSNVHYSKYKHLCMYAYYKITLHSMAVIEGTNFTFYYTYYLLYCCMHVCVCVCVYIHIHTYISQQMNMCYLPVYFNTTFKLLGN
jgi:hypothetical protein